MNSAIHKKLLPAALAILMAGCGSDTQTASPASTQGSATTAGYYAGTVTQGSTSSDISGAIASDGTALFYAPSVDKIYAGQFSQNGQALSGNLNVYAVQGASTYGAIGAQSGSASFNDVVSAQATVTATDSSTSGVNASISATYNTNVSGKGASLAGLAGTYGASDTNLGTSLTLSIDSQGVLTGTDNDGCTYSAQVSVPNAAINVYKLSNAAISCNDSTINGTGLLVVTADGQITTGFYDGSHAAVAALTKTN